MPLFTLLLASMVFAVGGLFMKLSSGATRLIPTLIFLALFAVGAVLQAVGMKHGEMGVSYVLVLGAEAVGATLLSALVLHEAYSPGRLAATMVIVIGIVWLRAT